MEDIPYIGPNEPGEENSRSNGNFVSRIGNWLRSKSKYDYLRYWKVGSVAIAVAAGLSWIEAAGNLEKDQHNPALLNNPSQLQTYEHRVDEIKKVAEDIIVIAGISTVISIAVGGFAKRKELE